MTIKTVSEARFLKINF